MSVSFDKKLAELDAYLQMLISENESLDKKLLDYTRSSNSTINNYETEIEGIINIKNNLEKLLSSIKHAIVLLQIAKVSSRSSISLSGSAIDLRSSSATPTPPPPTRPTRSSKLTSSSSRDSTKSSTAERRNKSAAGGRQTDSCNTRELSQQQPSSKSTAVAVSDAELHQDHTLSHHTAPSAVAKEPAAAEVAAVPQSSQLHDTTSRGVELATPPRSVAHVRQLTTSDTNNVVTSNLNGEVLNYKSEDEDEDDAFYDADDDQQNQTQSTLNSNDTKLFDTPIHPNPSSSSSSLTSRETPATATTTTDIIDQNSGAQGRGATTTMSETNNNVNSAIGDGSIDWDAMYEEEEEDELGSLEGQGSVIKHLLSQIRIGMDLTKVVLPTFILERRSLLEMYADFFAHPDLFSSISDYPSPEERMIQLVRWYMSAFHAGRKSSLAKKPYNPILGEIFRCQWKLVKDHMSVPRTSSINNCDSSKIQTPNVINADDNEPQEQILTFVAEQVSHHPPVSAFYAENKEKSISCCAHIYTKSKYLGLSVGVHNIGQGVITLSKHNETYTCTFPSAYGRSILTVPWVELGDPVTINCEQTGYKANIQFLTKPFYGGKKHRVTGEIIRPNNQPFMTIDGEWNGIMYSKSPPNSGEKKIFVDTTNLPVIKKNVKPVSVQESFESRNVWKEVTRALKMKDVNSATAAKSYIEQRQRDLLKSRTEQGVKWKTRYFEAASDDSWRYSAKSELDEHSDN